MFDLFNIAEVRPHPLRCGPRLPRGGANPRAVRNHRPPKGGIQKGGSEQKVTFKGLRIEFSVTLSVVLVGSPFSDPPLGDGEVTIRSSGMCSLLTLENRRCGYFAPKADMREGF